MSDGVVGSKSPAGSGLASAGSEASTPTGERRWKHPSESSLSIVIPSFNAERWIGPTLEHIWAAVAPTPWKAVEIIVVDDGSTDATAEVAEAALENVDVTVLRQTNAGRLAARRAGLMAAGGDYVFFLDSRVYADAGSFNHLLEVMESTPDAVVWNGHVEIPRKGNPFARFWHVVAFLAWRRYFAAPRLTSYSIEDFDYYPKGTGCFFAPRKVLIQAYDEFRTAYADERNANDDTALIRHIAARERVYLSPCFRFYYNARDTFRGFLRHTEHRGVVFIDGFLVPGARYRVPLLAYLVAAPLAVAAAVYLPMLLLTVPLGLLIAFVAARLAGVEREDAIAFALVAPVFVPAYTVGLYHGLYLRWVGRRNQRVRG